jgi:ribonuclease-3 family protein
MIKEDFYENIFKTVSEVTGKSFPDTVDFSPLALAYIGDTVFEVFVRTLALSEGNVSTHKLHQKSVRFVKASVQAKILKELPEYITFSEEESNIIRRGRNAKS